MKKQAPACHLDAVGSHFPIHSGDVKGLKNAFPHILQQWPTCQTANDHRQGMGRHRVIVEFLAHMMEIALKPRGEPVFLAHEDTCVLQTSRCHHEHVTHGEAIQRGGQCGGHLVAQVF